ncbi:Transcription factor adf-1 [Temnothorax longispinosus]|uniref:Transcription factor adf-1 n=1 Tax=Temnothorax longispinosus TaxID=300112 RepID=A0A4S2KQV5_9HYME|nr:Transcription factor adf-1 [Temnothorax longispinosus]
MSDHNQYCNMFNESDEVFIKDTDELLIDAVRAYPHLYNHQDRNFKDHVMKENSWKEISLAVNLPVSDCQTRWVRLRERFGKEKRQRELDSRSGSGISRRAVSYKCFKFKTYVEVMENKAHNHVSSATALSPIQIDRQVTNSSTNSEIISSTKSPASCAASQLSNIADEVLIEPCANFSTSFKTNFLQGTGPSSLLATSLEDNSSTPSDSFRRCTDTPHRPDEHDQSTTSSMFSLKEFTPSPASTTPQATPLLRRPLTKKKNDLTGLESSLVTLCQTMHQRLQSNRNSDIAGSSDEIFARLIVNQLETLPSHEKQKRQQTIMQILYAPYDP